MKKKKFASVTPHNPTPKERTTTQEILIAARRPIETVDPPTPLQALKVLMAAAAELLAAAKSTVGGFDVDGLTVLPVGLEQLSQKLITLREKSDQYTNLFIVIDAKFGELNERRAEKAKKPVHLCPPPP